MRFNKVMKRGNRKISRRHHRLKWPAIGIVVAVLLFGGILGLLHYAGNQSDTLARQEHASVSVHKKVVSEEEYSVSVLFMGDTLLARRVGPAIASGEDPFEHVRPILDNYDFRVANIESVIADPAVAHTPANKRFTFNAPLGVLQSIKSAPINLSVLANNHTGDFGRAAMLDMVQQFNKAELEQTGIGENIDAAFQPYITELALRSNSDKHPTLNIKVGFIAYNDFENQHSDAGVGRPGSAFYDEARLKKSIDDARSAGAEFVFAIPHWGTEYAFNSFNQRQQTTGRWLIDAGADAVIGGHPHVIQPTEIYNGKPIVYSIGNFIFPGMESVPNATRGQMIGFTIKKKVTLADGKITGDAQGVLGNPAYHYYNLNQKGYPVPE